MFVLSDLRWLWGCFISSVGLFERVGLKTNVRNKVVMVCDIFQAAGTQSEAADGRRMTVAGNSYWER